MPTTANRTVLQAALRVLFLMAREDIHADRELLTEALELTALETDALLEELERGGLVDADRVRLTLSGLALAAGLDALEAQAQQERVRALMDEEQQPRRGSEHAA